MNKKKYLIKNIFRGTIFFVMWSSSSLAITAVQLGMIAISVYLLPTLCTLNNLYFSIIAIVIAILPKISLQAKTSKTYQYMKLLTNFSKQFIAICLIMGISFSLGIPFAQTINLFFYNIISISLLSYNIISSCIASHYLSKAPESLLSKDTWLQEAKITINRSANKMSIIGDTSHTDSAIMILNMFEKNEDSDSQQNESKPITGGLL